MNRRHTITTKPNNDYPEHLNPFSDEGDDTTNNNKSVSSLGRRNSRLTASFRSINSWSIFSSKKSKKEDRKGNEFLKTDKDKFMTLTPKHRSHILETIPAKGDKSKPLNLNGTSEDTPRRTPTRDLCEEFKLTPKSDRYRSHSMTSAVPVPVPVTVPERRLSPGQCPVPLPRRTITQSERTVIENEVQSTSTERRPTLKIQEEDDGKYIQQGARPKKKRRAPLPPTLAPTSTTAHATINNTESNATELGHVASNSEETADVRACESTTADSSQSTAIQRDGNETSNSTQPNEVPASRTPTDSSSRPIVVPSPRKAIAGTEASAVPITTSTTRADSSYILPSSRTVKSGAESIAVADLKDDPAARDERTAVPSGSETTAAVAKPSAFPGIRTITSRTEDTTVVPVSRTITSRTEDTTVVPVSRTITSRTEDTSVVPVSRTITSRTEDPTVVPVSRTITSRIEDTTVVPVSRTITSRTEDTTVVPVSRTITSRTEDTTVVPVSRTITSRTESTIVPSPRTVISRSDEKPVVLGYKRPVTSRTTAVFGSRKATFSTEPVPVSRTATTSTQLSSVSDTRTTLSNAEPTTLGTTTSNEPVPSPKTVTSSIDTTEGTRPGTTTTHGYLKVVPESRTTEPTPVLNTPVDGVPREQLETATEEELEQKLLLDEKLLIEKVEKLTNLIISS